MKKISWILCAIFLCMPFSLAHADIGPKPSIQIEVQGAEETYFLDLLIPKETSHLSTYGNHSLRQEDMDLLASYRDENWVSSTFYDSGMPLFQDPYGEQDENGNRVHIFSYHGTPQYYRILLVEKKGDGNFKLSEPIHRKAFRQSLILDARTMDVKEVSLSKNGVWKNILWTLPMTLLVEGCILWLMGLGKRKNLPLFFGMNIFTQFALYWVIFFNGGGFFSLVVYEFFILLIEMVLSYFFPEGKGWKKVLFAFLANLATFGITLLPYFVPAFNRWAISL